MTQQRANIPNEFFAGASGKADGFRYFKDPSTLVTYFTTMKQLFVYHYRVVHCKGGHFTRAKSDQVLPRNAIRPTKTQTQAMDRIMVALAVEAKEEAELALKHAIRRLPSLDLPYGWQRAVQITRLKLLCLCHVKQESP